MRSLASSRLALCEGNDIPPKELLTALPQDRKDTVAILWIVIAYHAHLVLFVFIDPINPAAFVCN